MRFAALCSVLVAGCTIQVTGPSSVELDSGVGGMRPETSSTSSASGGDEATPTDAAVERCESGDTQSCWETEEGALLPGTPQDWAGSCRAGRRECDDDGGFGACRGAVGPAADDSCLERGADETCNGEPNEGCECIFGETMCRDGSTTLLLTCNERGEWDESTCDYVCESGECAGECEPGKRRCSDDPERIQVCVGGTWDDNETCASGFECTGEGAACKASNGMGCDADADCAGSTCVDGICCAERCEPVLCAELDTECLTHPASVSENLCDVTGECRAAVDVCAEVTTPANSGRWCTLADVDGARCDGAGECVAPTVECGEETCSRDETACCLRDFEGADPEYECVAEGECADELVDFQIRCDEDTDCGNGGVCCRSLGAGSNGLYCATPGTCPRNYPYSSSRLLCSGPVFSRPCDEGETCGQIADVPDYSTCSL